MDVRVGARFTTSLSLMMVLSTCAGQHAADVNDREPRSPGRSDPTDERASDASTALDGDDASETIVSVVQEERPNAQGETEADAMFANACHSLAEVAARTRLDARVTRLAPVRNGQRLLPVAGKLYVSASDGVYEIDAKAGVASRIDTRGAAIAFDGQRLLRLTPYSPPSSLDPSHPMHLDSLGLTSQQLTLAEPSIWSDPPAPRVLSSGLSNLLKADDVALSGERTVYRNPHAGGPGLVQIALEGADAPPLLPDRPLQSFSAFREQLFGIDTTGEVLRIPADGAAPVVLARTDAASSISAFPGGVLWLDTKRLRFERWRASSGELKSSPFPEWAHWNGLSNDGHDAFGYQHAGSCTSLYRIGIEAADFRILMQVSEFIQDLAGDETGLYVLTSDAAYHVKRRQGASTP